MPRASRSVYQTDFTTILRPVIDPLSYLLARRASAPLVLMYHAVQSSSPDWPWAVSLDQLLAQLDLLRDLGWRTATVGELFAVGSLPPRTIVLTFDDGYANTWPVLEALVQRDQRATWFVVTRWLGTYAGWVHSGKAPRLLLTTHQLRDLDQGGMEIGAHGRHHWRLPEIDDITLQEELSGSKAELEDHLGCEVTSFAYPYGHHDDRVVAATAQAGFHSACTVRSGHLQPGGDWLRIPRVGIFAQDSLATFARKLALAQHAVPWGGLVRQLLGHSSSINPPY